jgi:hypothetical protein
MAGSMSVDGVKRGKKGPYERCPICGYAYPKSEMKKYKGKWYCVQNGCYKDIADMIRKRR